MAAKDNIDMYDKAVDNAANARTANEYQEARALSGIGSDTAARAQFAINALIVSAEKVAGVSSNQQEG